MVFAAAGLAIALGGGDEVRLDVDHDVIHVVAELTLILVLFSDAARIDVRRVRADHDLPVRMLILGLPLTIALGAVFAAFMFPAFSLWEAALLAALLAPTDAALGQSVVTSPAVPLRVRLAINIESGLNDGIALPAVLMLAALASAASSDAASGHWLVFAAKQMGLGPVAGVAVGFLGARLIDRAATRGWATAPFQGVGILTLSVFSYVVAELIGGNGFISAFVAGVVLGNSVRNECHFLFEFMESEGQLLTLITFLVFGAALLPEGLSSLQAAHVLYAVLSLTVIRMLPVAVSLIGSKVQLPTCLFLGWFGPRGLASILYVLLILDESAVPHRDEILSVTVITVGLSILLHGVTAGPFARIYGRFADGMGDGKEMSPVPDMPLRAGAKSATTDR